MRTKGLKTDKQISPIQPPKTGERGKPAIYDKYRMPYIAHILCKEHGFTHEQLARVFSVSKKTVDYWVLKHEEFQVAVRTGRDEYDSNNVEQMLLKRAMGYKYTERSVKRVYIKGKDLNGNIVSVPGKEVTITEKEIAPETRAIMYWLTNRQPDRWKMAININADIKTSGGPAKVAVKADLSQLNTEQLRMLKELVTTQKTIEVNNGSGEQLSIEHIMREAEDAILVNP